MGQKVHPRGFRLGVIEGWDSKWYAGREYATLLHEDIRIRQFIKRRLYHAGIAKVEIERAANKAKVNVHTARPGHRHRQEGRRDREYAQRRTPQEKNVSLLGPADLGVLASVGRATVSVHRRPRVAILSTGAELVEVDETPGPGQVVNSNAYALAGAVAEAGGEPVVLPIVRDRFEDIRDRLAEAAEADVVLSTGGVSVGEFDFVKEALDALGVERRFWKVAQKPGKPLTFGTRGGHLFFGLPGNPGLGARLLRDLRAARPPSARRSPPLHLPAVEATLETPGEEGVALDRVRARLAVAGRARMDGAAGPLAELGRAHVARRRRWPARRPGVAGRAGCGGALPGPGSGTRDPGAETRRSRVRVTSSAACEG